MQVPMIWCPSLEKNVAFEDLKVEVSWEHTEQYSKCYIAYLLNGVPVRGDLHVGIREGLSLFPEQAKL